MSPDLVRNHIMFAVAHGFVSIDGHVAGDRLDDARSDSLISASLSAFDRRSVHLVEEAVSLLLYDDFGLMRRAFLRFVAEIDPDAAPGR